MRDLVIADLRHSIRIWAGSLLVLAVTQLCAMWVTGLLFVGIGNLWMTFSRDLPPLVDSTGATIPPEIASFLPSGIVSATSFSFVIVAVVSSITVGNVVNTIVYQRRRVMALWQLAGMTDRQMLGILRAQIALLSLVAFAAAAAVALLTVEWILDLLRATDLLFTPPMTTGNIYVGYAVGAAAGILICIVAVRAAGKELRAISPLEAIRSEGVRELPMTKKRWIGMLVWGAISVAFAITALSSTTMSSAGNSSLFTGLFALVAFVVGGPLIVIGLIRVWTRVVPEHVSASWFLARSTLLAATARSVATVGSIAIAVFLFTALFSQASAGGAEADVAGFVLIAGLPLAISVTGSVVLVFMAGQQREREIHLAELAGATPAQQKRQAIFEAVIVLVTGSGVGLLLSVVMIAVLQPALITTTGAPAFGIAWGYFAGISLTLLALNVIATVVPTVIAHAARDRIAITG